MTRGRWTYVGGRAGHTPSEGEKHAISQACEAFIKDVLKPRFLPEIRPTQFNYPVDIFGKWHGGKYRFIQRRYSAPPDPNGNAANPATPRCTPVSPLILRRYWCTSGSCNDIQRMNCGE